MSATARTAISKNTAKVMTSKSLSPRAKIVPRRSSERGHADHGWLNSHHTFSFASYHDPRFQSFGSLRVLNEDRVAPLSGFPTHPHRDAEIFSYILSGELTHRDSMLAKQPSSTTPTTTTTNIAAANKNDYYRMARGDVQFTTGGTGIAHSEQNEHATDPVHFLQIWATPWKRGLPPTYHTASFAEASKRNAFVRMISPLEAGPGASAEEERAAVPVVGGTIPIHADFVMGAAVVEVGERAGWGVGGGVGVVRRGRGRNVYVHLPMRGVGARVRLAGGTELAEGDGAFVSGVDVGEELVVESIGKGEAEVVVLDSD